MYVYDGEGRRWLDLESGVWCLPLGHGCSAVNEAVFTQMNKCTHTGYCYTDEIVERTAERLLTSAGFNAGRCAFLTSGSEAVETGVQIIRAVTGGKLLLTFTDSFLGSHGSAAKKGADEWHQFDWLGCADCARDCKNCPLFMKIPFDKIGGFVFEPGSSSGLVRFPPENLVSAIAKEVKNRGGILMANEITTGFGRTGKMYGYEHYGYSPDIVCVGKGAGNGYPVSAVILNNDTAEKTEDAHFKLSQSHQNDPAGASAVSAVLREFERLDIITASRDQGRYFLSRLTELKDKYPFISDVRGRGLMMSVTLDGLPEDAVQSVFEKLFEAGYIIVRRPGLKVFRIDPPLIITREQTDGFISAFDVILSRV